MTDIDKLIEELEEEYKRVEPQTNDNDRDLAGWTYGYQEGLEFAIAALKARIED